MWPKRQIKAGPYTVQIMAIQQQLAEVRKVEDNSPSGSTCVDVRVSVSIIVSDISLCCVL